MILLDTSVLIQYLRTGDVTILNVLATNPTTVSVVTRAEILQGAKSTSDFTRLTGVLDGFLQVGVENATWVELAQNLFQFRSRGITAPFPDALIATIAVRHGHEVWTL